MLDFFTIFSKGGIVLWCFQGAGASGSFTGPVNALIRSVILQERSGNNSFTYDSLSLKYKLDNEFELVFVVGFQKILTLTYVDKLIDDVQLLFRDRYKNELEHRGALMLLSYTFEFGSDFLQLLRQAEDSSKARAPVAMKTFQESQKSQKTVKSMIETKGGDKGKESSKKNKTAKKEAPAPAAETAGDSPRGGAPKSAPKSSLKVAENGSQGLSSEEIIQRNREEFFRKRGKATAPDKQSSSKSPRPPKPRGKENRVWDNGGSSSRDLDYS
uniref:SRP receptor subunit alpha n=1 Tax=Lepisosteus oculatus TaxID=7918 RepID=W5M954_LEPOC